MIKYEESDAIHEYYVSTLKLYEVERNLNFLGGWVVLLSAIMVGLTWKVLI